MKCSNCGMNLEDGAAFCPYCGSKTEEPAGADNAVAVVILLVLFGGKLFSGKEKKTAEEVNYVRYAKDNVFYLMDKDKKKPMELGDVPRDRENEDLYQNTEYWGSATSYYSKWFYTEDGKGRYFILEDDLYYKNLKKPGEEAERIDKDVWNFYIVDNDTLVYIKDDDRRLYVSKKGTAEKVDKEIGWDVKISDDHKRATVRAPYPCTIL